METQSKRATAKVASKTNDQELAREAGGVSSKRGGELLLSLTERKKVELGTVGEDSLVATVSNKVDAIDR